MALSEFEWTEEAQGAMDLLKHLASTAVPVRRLDYELAQKVKQPDQRESDVGLVSIHVDASNIGVGWMIAQRLGSFMESLEHLRLNDIGYTTSIFELSWMQDLSCK